MKIALEERFPHLQNAPIVEAVIELRARAETAWQEVPISDQLKARLPDYPNVESKNEIRQEIRLGPGTAPEALTHDLGWKGLRCQSADQRHIAQFNRDGFIFSRLYPYEDWEHLKDEAMRLWQIYVRVATPSAIQRIGLRYINRITLPPSGVQLEDYIQPHPETPRGLDLPFAHFFHQDTLTVTEHPYNVNVVRTIQPPLGPQLSSSGLILDIDVFTTSQCDCSQDVLDHSLAEMRWLKNKVFFGNVTPKALEGFR